MKKEKKTGRSRTERGMGQVKAQSASSSPARNDTTTGKARRLPSPNRAPIYHFPISYQKKKNPFPKGGGICLLDRLVLERDLSSPRKVLLRPQFKLISTIFTMVNRLAILGTFIIRLCT